MGWTFNTKDPDAPTIGPLITGVAIALTFLSLVTVCLRTYVRGVLIRAFGVDDWLILITWICSAGFAIITIIQTKWGLGLKHIEDLPAVDIYNFGLLQYMGAPFYITSILGFKLALLFSYLRFLPIATYRVAIYFIAAACVLFHLSFLLVQINLCQPAKKQWDPAVTWGKCIPGVPFYTSMASITIVFDVTVMLLPFPVLLKSRIQRRKKLILLGLFGLGVFITVIQIIRIQTVKQLVNYVDSAPLILWSTVENNLGIVVANVPTLAPLVKYYNERGSSGKGYVGTGSVGGTGGGPYASGGRSAGAGGGGGGYASGTWRSGNRSNRSRGAGGAAGLDTLVDSNVEMESYDGGVSCGKGTGSMDSILDSAGKRDGAVEVPGAGITKKVEVVITRR